MIINITIKQIVYDAIIEAISKDYYELTSKLDLPFNNNKPNLTFDLLSRNIRDKINNNINLIPVKRSSREFYIIYDKKEKYIYSIMNYNSFKSNNLPMYLKALSKEYNSDISLQKELFEFNEPNIKYDLIVNKIFKNVDNEIKNNIDRYCIIVYHIKRDNLILLENHILDKNLDEYKIENWLTDDTIKPNPIILDNNLENYSKETKLKLKKKSENILIEKGIINKAIISKNNIKYNKENKEIENE